MKQTHIVLFLISISLFNCKEPFEVESIDFLNAFVVESTITNELKQQEVSLTKTYALDSQTLEYENNADIWIEDSSGNNYSFSQNAEGIYLSNQEFQAIENRTYQLFITTQDGKQYSSTQVESTPISQITDLYAEFITKSNGEKGIQVFVDSDNENSEAQYFRYDYEETYMVVAPEWTPTDIKLENPRNDELGRLEFDIILSQRLEQERICYKTDLSIGINQTSTTDLEQNNIERYPIRFLNEDNGLSRDRYSILVTQYVQGLEAYTFYKMINDLGSSGNILSPSQPGFVSGNIKSFSNESEKVIGYFDVSTVDSKRIYFDYEDFIDSGMVQPPYLYTCNIVELNYNKPFPFNDRIPMYSSVVNFDYNYVNYNGLNYTLVNPECGDCTSVASNIKPDFWED
ncbi:DUF4249 domain-containing protein [Bizionia arctica]|nr:DUF4249 domain-containing protein [Bizionia arctica]